MRIINAGLPAVIGVDQAGKIIHQAGSGNLPLGIMDSEYESFKAVEISMRQEECFYLYSDGVTEATNGAGQMWGETGLQHALQMPLEGESRLEALELALVGFMGDATQTDDISVLEYRVSRALLAVSVVKSANESVAAILTGGRCFSGT